MSNLVCAKPGDSHGHDDVEHHVLRETEPDREADRPRSTENTATVHKGTAEATR